MTLLKPTRTSVLYSLISQTTHPLKFVQVILDSALRLRSLRVHGCARGRHPRLLVCLHQIKIRSIWYTFRENSKTELYFLVSCRYTLVYSAFLLLQNDLMIYLCIAHADMINRIMGVSLTVISFSFLATFPTWHEEMSETGSIQERKPLPSRRICQVALAASFIAAVLELATILWQHTASVATATTVTEMAYGTVITRVGIVAMTFGWMAVALSIVVLIGLLVVILTMQIVEEFNDED